MRPATPFERASVARRILDAVAVGAFLTAIVAPTIDGWFRPDSARSPELIELRAPAPEPEAPQSARELAKYPASYEAYFKDTFGLRDRLLRWNSIVKVFGLGVSPCTEVFFGKQGWMFYTGQNSEENHRGNHPFRPRLLQRWGEVLERKRADLDALGIRYLYVIAPDKETVYAELLPDSMRAIGPTRRELLTAYLREHHPKVEILDLSDCLREAKRDDGPDDFVYGKFGTHWTGRGARVALRAILERLDQQVGGFEPEAVDDFERKEFDDMGDSWAPRMYIKDLLSQPTTSYQPASIRAKVRYESRFGIGRVLKTELDDSTRPRVMLVHDSFGPYIEVGLAEQCSYLECHWDLRVDPADIEAAEPQVFVDMFVERTLNQLAPEGLLPTDLSRWRRAFEGSSTTLLALDKSLPDWGLQAVGGTVVGPASLVPEPGLALTLKDPSDRIALPALAPVPGELPILHFRIDTAAATEFLLFYRPPGTPEFLRRSSYRKTLKKGANDFYLPLDRAGTCGDLEIRPGTQGGDFFLRECEIRSVPAP
ncbi:MAG TPA: hypothetical protein VM509_04760 [Planctomycetota bacterium]|nr:hypothetical protein [Planctomycetota bacterium]